MNQAIEIVEPDDSTSESLCTPEKDRPMLVDGRQHTLRRNLSNQRSIGKKRGRRPKWWTAAMFHLSPGRGKYSAEMFKTCKGCSWQTKAQRPRAMLLGLHLLGCSSTSSELKQKLLEEDPLRKHYNKHRNIDGMTSGPLQTAEEKRNQPNTSFDGACDRSDSDIPPPNMISTSQLGPQIVSTYIEPGEGENESNEPPDQAERHEKAKKLLTRAIASGIFPLSILRRKAGEDHLYQLLTFLDPAFAASLPTSEQMTEKDLTNYFDTERKRVKCAIDAVLRETYGTIILDEQTKSNGTVVVNALLSIPGQSYMRETFFLRSFLVGCKGMTANVPESLVEDAIKEYGDIKSISGIVSTNTSCCLKAKLHATKNHNHLLSSYDQVHVGKLLFKDMGILPWISDVLSSLFQLFTNLFLHSELYDRLKVMKDKFDEESSKHFDFHGVSVSHGFVDDAGRLRLPMTCSLPEQMVPIPFLSASVVLQSFLTYREVLKELVKTPEFFSGKNATSARRLFFIQTVTSRSLFLKALDVYHILRLIRQYLRLFDDECSIISEVYPANMQLRKKLTELPTTFFYTEERRSEVIRVFDDRLYGRNGKLPLLTTLHRAAYFLDIRSVVDDLANENDHLLTHIAHFVKSSCFPQELRGGEERGACEAVELLYEEYQCLRRLWTQEMKDEKHNLTQACSGIPVVYWWQNRNNSSYLREFALRVLGISPSSASVVRDRSMHERISICLQSKLDEDRLQNRIFCSWNGALSLHRSRKYEGVTSTKYRSLRAETCFSTRGSQDGVSIHSTGKGFSKFFEDEHVSNVNANFELPSCSVESGECGICYSVQSE